MDPTNEIDCADQEVVSRIYRTMGKPIVAKAFTILGRMDVAKEIAQEVFLRLWRSKLRFPEDRAVYGWLYKTCHRACIDHIKSAASRKESLADTEDLDVQQTAQFNTPNFGDLLLTRGLVQKYLARLPERDAEIFVYVALDEMSHGEVAELLGVATKTVQRSLQKAQLIFRTAIHEQS